MTRYRSPTLVQPREVVGAVSEAAFAEVVRQYALLMGWKIYHTYLAIRSTAGFPDLCLVRPPRVIFAELKSEKGHVSPAQIGWLDSLALCPGVKTYLWRPSDWDEIERILVQELRAPLVEAGKRGMEAEIEID